MKGREALVATASPGDNCRNTLVLSEIELVVPLEADLDGDPESPDSIKLVHEDGAYEAVLTEGDPDVEKDGDNPLNNYHFHSVPLGLYRVEVKVDDGWYVIISGLRVTSDGVFIGDQPAEGKTDGSSLGTPEQEMTYDLPEYLEETTENGSES